MRPPIPLSTSDAPIFRLKAAHFLLSRLLPLIGLMPLLFTVGTFAQDEYEELAEAILRSHNEEERKTLLIAKPELEAALVSLGNRRYQEAKYEDALVAY